MISVVDRIALSSNRKFSSQSIAQLLVAPNAPNSCVGDHPVLADFFLGSHLLKRQGNPDYFPECSLGSTFYYSIVIAPLESNLFTRQILRIKGNNWVFSLLCSQIFFIVKRKDNLCFAPMTRDEMNDKRIYNDSGAEER